MSSERLHLSRPTASYESEAQLSALSMYSKTRGNHATVSWQMDDMFSLVYISLQLVSLVPFIVPHVSHNQSQSADDAE